MDLEELYPGPAQAASGLRPTLYRLNLHFVIHAIAVDSYYGSTGEGSILLSPLLTAALHVFCSRMVGHQCLHPSVQLEMLSVLQIMDRRLLRWDPINPLLKSCLTELALDHSGLFKN